MDHNNILAVVLAGGKSKRFGRDKSQVKLGNKILIDYILDEIIDFYKDILVVTNEPIKFSNSNKISLTSDFQKGLGPLGGVLSAMKWIKDNKKNLVLFHCWAPWGSIANLAKAILAQGFLVVPRAFERWA